MSNRSEEQSDSYEYSSDIDSSTDEDQSKSIKELTIEKLESSIEIRINIEQIDDERVHIYLITNFGYADYILNYKKQTITNFNSDIYIYGSHRQSNYYQSLSDELMDILIQYEGVDKFFKVRLYFHAIDHHMGRFYNFDNGKFVQSMYFGSDYYNIDIIPELNNSRFGKTKSSRK